jgi:hypothetical protein
MNDQACSTCEFCFVCRCHRYPPVMLPPVLAAGLDLSYIEWEYPEVSAYNSWCGEYRRSSRIVSNS